MYGVKTKKSSTSNFFNCNHIKHYNNLASQICYLIRCYIFALFLRFLDILRHLYDSTDYFPTFFCPYIFKHCNGLTYVTIKTVTTYIPPTIQADFR